MTPTFKLVLGSGVAGAAVGVWPRCRRKGGSSGFAIRRDPINCAARMNARIGHETEELNRRANKI
jgi:hypothetical protein